MGGVCSTYEARRRVYRFVVERPEGNHLEDPGVDWSIILKWIFQNWNRDALTRLFWLRLGIGGGRL